MNSFKVELHKISFDQQTNSKGCPNGDKLVTVTKLSDESYQEFKTLKGLAGYLECCAHQFNKKEAAKILSKATMWLFR